MQESRHKSLIIHSLSVEKIFVGWLIELAAILDSFYWPSQYHNASI